MSLNINGLNFLTPSSGLSVLSYQVPGLAPRGLTSWAANKSTPTRVEENMFYNCFFQGRDPCSMSTRVSLTLTSKALRALKEAKRSFPPQPQAPTLSDVAYKSLTESLSSRPFLFPKIAQRLKDRPYPTALVEQIQ